MQIVSPMQGKDNVWMAVNANWLYCACIVHGFHMRLEARVEFEYVCQLISILFLRKDFTVNLEHKCADRSFGWQNTSSHNTPK